MKQLLIIIKSKYINQYKPLLTTRFMSTYFPQFTNFIIIFTRFYRSVSL